MRFLPSRLTDVKLLAQFVIAEFARLAEALARPQESTDMVYLHAAPTKVRAGMHVLADGVDWDPNSGEGLYRRSADNTTWVFIG